MKLILKSKGMGAAVSHGFFIKKRLFIFADKIIVIGVKASEI